MATHQGSRSDGRDRKDVEVHVPGGFIVPPIEIGHELGGDLRRGELNESRLQMPTPSISPSSTAVSRAPTPASYPENEPTLKPILDHIDPESARSTPRELHESNPFSVPRKHEQVLITERHDPYQIPAFDTLEFPHRVFPPNQEQTDPWEAGGWYNVIHPDGSLYFHKAYQGQHGICSIFTEAYLYGDAMFKEISVFARYIWDHVGGRIDYKDFEIVINVKIDKCTNKIIWSYYLIDHVRRMPFWMRPYNPSTTMRTTERLGVSSPDHLLHLLKAMYWEHCALFPRHSRGARVFHEDVYAKLCQDLTWCASESIIAPVRYTAPFTVEEALKLREQIDYLRKNTAYPEQCIEVAGRVIGMLEGWRYDYLHGTQVIRRFRGQSVLPPRPHSWPYRLLTPLLFYAPLAHVYDCKGVYLDGVIANEPEWTRHVKKLLSEWLEFVLYATILLNANLAFLSVPNTILFPQGDTNSETSRSGFQHELVSPAAILSCCSMITSTGSMAIGLLLIRQHRGEEIMDNPRTDKDTFIEKRRSGDYGFELLSVLYSLPYALLMWSIGLFLAALVTFTQLGTDWPNRAAVIAVLAIVVAMSFWCVRMGWGTSQNQDFFRYKREVLPTTPFESITTRAKPNSNEPEAPPLSGAGSSWFGIRRVFSPRTKVNELKTSAAA